MKNSGPSLTEAEIDELEAFLISDTPPEACMDLPTLDGFFTALVIGPETLMPSQWLPVVWGETEDDEMIWDSMDQMERITGLIMRLMNSIADTFKKNPENFEPHLYTREVEGESISIIDEWCHGFMKGVRLRPKAWTPIFTSDKGAALVMLMGLYGTDEGRERLEKEGSSLEQYKRHLTLLAPSVHGIFNFWLARREQPSKTKTTKVGRNEPCPCGSGKKFKKCCG